MRKSESYPYTDCLFDTDTRTFGYGVTYRLSYAHGVTVSNAGMVHGRRRRVQLRGYPKPLGSVQRALRKQRP